MAPPTPLTLACPRCRGLRDGVFVVRSLHPRGDTLCCDDAACGAVYPVRGGIPVVFGDLRPVEGDPALADRLVGAYVRAWDDPGWPNAPRERLRALLAGLEPGRRALDLCAGTARAAGLLTARFEGVVAVDAWWPFLAGGLATLPREARERVQPVCADALDPPLFAETFDLVYLGAAVDSVRAPLLLLGQADALLAPGGLLVAATPFAWNDAVTPPDQRLDGPAELAAVLAGRVPGLEHLDYDVIDEAAGLAWRLRPDGATDIDFEVHWIVARKRRSEPPG